MSQPQSEKALFTCLSCAIAFVSPEEQRAHYRSDFHRYNMKRRIAALPPVTSAIFDDKVLERQAEIALTASAKDLLCVVCNKAYTTKGAYRSHMNSRKHQEKQNSTTAPLHSLAHPEPSGAPPLPVTTPHSFFPVPESMPGFGFEVKGESLNQEEPISNHTPDNASDQNIDDQISAARAQISPTHCLFCPLEASSLETNVTHMSQAHSFFIPDADYLIDLPGLLEYLGEKIAIGNVCIFCDERGREFRSLSAVRKHMTDKSHCKIAYDSTNDRLEISDFYDFTSSYPDAETQKLTKTEDVWEDISSDESDGHEVVEAVGSSQPDAELQPDDILLDNELSYGDSHFELVLPSGARIGHRTMRRYYAQNLSGAGGEHAVAESNSGAALVRRLLADKKSVLVPRKGGFGAFGKGTEVVKAKNRGEAREAGRHIREFRDQKRREEFRTKVGFIANSQKHYRDPLLQ